MGEFMHVVEAVIMIALGISIGFGALIGCHHLSKLSRGVIKRFDRRKTNIPVTVDRRKRKKRVKLNN